jgi:predicted transposase/invertase (TIGR01784 family)
MFASNDERSEILLKNFLNEVLGLKEGIKEITYLNPYNNKETQDDKISVLDLKIKDEESREIDIEMQLNNIDNYRKRSLYYWSCMYSETIKEGKTYEELKKCIIINILDFKLIKETKRYHTVYKIMEIKEKYEYIDDLELHYIELPKFREKKTINELDMLEKWILFIKETGMKGKEKKVEELIESEEVLKMAAQKIKELSKDEQMRQRYLARQKALMDKRSAERYREILLERATMNGMQKGLEEGIKKGIEKGKLEGKLEGEYKKAIETAKNLIKHNISRDIIIKSTGLTEKEVSDIEKQIKKS